MNEFLQSLGSLGWWLGVVLVGIVLNILSAYLKPKLDNYLSNISIWWQNRTNKTRSAREKTIAILKSDNHKQILMLAEESRHRSRCIVFLLFSVFFLLLYLSLKINYYTAMTAGVAPPPYWIRIFTQWFSVFLMFIGILENSAAIKCKTLVNACQVQNEDMQ